LKSAVMIVFYDGFFCGRDGLFVLYPRCLWMLCCAAALVSLAACQGPQNALHTYDVSGNDLGVSTFKEISGAESRVSFVGEDPVKRREAQILRDRYSERITFKNNATIRYGRMLNGGLNNANDDIDLIQFDVQNSVFFHDVALIFDKSKIKSGGYYHYLLESTVTHNCFVFRGEFGDTRAGGGGFAGINRGDQEVQGGICYPRKTKALDSLERELTDLLGRARFDDGALNRTRQWPQVAVAAVDPIPSRTQAAGVASDVFATCYSPHLDAIYRAKVCGKGDAEEGDAAAATIENRLQRQRVKKSSGAPFVPTRPGTTITMQDGGWLRLVATDDMVMTTVDSAGRIAHHFAMFLPLAVEAQFDRRIADGLWPLEVGNEASVVVTRGDQSWRYTLKVLRSETVTIPAGQFQTYVVERRQQGMGSNFHESIATYWYAPSVGTVVKFESKLLAGTSRDPPSWEAAGISK
jgi:hypothetical protein